MTELERQKEYIRKAAGLVQGRGLRYFVVTFGCQMNERDSEKIAGILEEMGYLPALQESEADLLLYNTCTVREHADKRLYGRLGVAKQIKQDRPGMLIALCGCMMQEAEVREKIRTSYPYVDLIFGTHNLYRFAELLYERLSEGRRVVEIWEEHRDLLEDLPKRRKYPFKSGVNIMVGCNNFCSYCIVPYVRGREYSRDPKEILKEVEALAEDGVKEVMLLGQNVNSYGKGLDRPADFSGLLSEAAQIPGIGRIRFMTSHPKDLSPDLIHVIRDHEKIARHIHLPLQSGSSRILSAMNRHYTKEAYLDLVARIREEIPEAAITTDIIVGFPTETEKDVDDTIDVIRKAGFDGAFTFQYSKRTGTPAALMEQLPREFVQEQFDRVLKCVQDTAKERAGRFTGRIMEVLVEGVNEKDPAMLTGRISQNHVVHFPGEGQKPGEFIEVSLDECHGFYYTGHVVKPTGKSC
ncbi:MAG: tRNA (N6-isopentenyl adenosine(37)-C2)-methylthiotransferase MiaB [Lachnospiraceae bacterium]|nr:tRNA (N6-isopentenyl adenosine(37)-C2)-methylthiotransferase MiaB [Lachnospiraceae bacterium]